MSSRFTGQLVVVTGAGRSGQIGEAVARAFGAEGARLMLLDRDPGVLDRAQEMTVDGLVATGHIVDLIDADAVSAIARGVGAVHAVAHIAGGFDLTGTVAETDPARWHRMIAINLTTSFIVARAFLPVMRASKGALCFVTSQATLPGGKPIRMAAYAAAKAGVNALVGAIALEEAPFGIRCNAVAPSAVRTGTNLESMGDDFPYVELDELAREVVQLCSADANRITGQIIALS